MSFTVTSQLKLGGVIGKKMKKRHVLHVLNMIFYIDFCFLNATLGVARGNQKKNDNYVYDINCM